MPITLLRELALQQLPAMFADPLEIAKLTVLRRRGEIVALMPNEDDSQARVLLITARGWQSLRASPARFWPPLR